MLTAEATRSNVNHLRSPELDRNGKYAVLSVSDKTGIQDFADVLVSKGYNIISTGGTAQTLSRHGIDVIPIEFVTGKPESFDGRVKTISFDIAGGISYKRDNPDHVRQAREQNLLDINLVVVNFYPFEQTVQRPGATDEEIMEQIDLGGPNNVRSAIKNCKHVTVVIDPSDYVAVAEAIQGNQVTEQFRRRLAVKAFNHMLYYDGQIGIYLSEGSTPEVTALPMYRGQELRYGENPHQKPAHTYFIPRTESPLARLKHHSGREMSHTNLTDIDAGLQAVRIFDKPAVAIIKHNTPCGIALGKNSAEALYRAASADPKSVFGGAVFLNTHADMNVVGVIRDLNRRGIKLDTITAPSMDEDVISAIRKIRKTTAIYTTGPIPLERKGLDRFHYRAIDGGFLVEPWDENFQEGFDRWTFPTTAQPSDAQIAQSQLAWKFLSRVRSNSVIIVDPKHPMTLGIGTGQTSRVDSAVQALHLAGERARGAILGSDSFFPFEDCVRLASEAGIGLVVQQGGSVNDQASIDAANSLNIPMIFTHTRAFWH